MTTTTQSRYIIQTAAACMPSSCWTGCGSYRRVAVIETDGREHVSMISTRARGVRRVVATWERLYAGSTERCAYGRALAAARELVASLTASSSEEA